MLISERPEEHKDIITALSQLGYNECLSPNTHQDSLPQISNQQPNLLVFAVETPSNDLLKTISLIDQEAPKPILLFATTCADETVSAFIQAGVASLIVGDIPYPRLSSVLDVALARFAESQKQRQELATYKQRLEDRKVIDKAKGILMEQKQLSEDEAYQLLRKMAMDRNLRMGEAARQFIAAAELLR